MKTVREPGGGARTVASGADWSLTLEATATGRPSEWTIAEAKLAAESKGSRLETIDRMIRDTNEANLTTTNHSSEMVHRGLELYRAINDSNGVCDHNNRYRCNRGGQQLNKGTREQGFPVRCVKFL